MSKAIPHFCAFVKNHITSTICGEAIINNKKSYIICDEKENRWYEAVMHGSFYRTDNYVKIQEVFWDTNTGGFIL